MPMKPPTHYQRLVKAGRIKVQPKTDNRASAAARGYDHLWAQTRDLFIMENPCCALCGGPASMVDHVVPLNSGGARLDPDNLRSLCRDCHARVTARYRKDGINELSDADRDHMRVMVANSCASHGGDDISVWAGAGPKVRQ